MLEVDKQANDSFHVVVGNILRKGKIFIPKNHFVKVKGHVRPIEQRLILVGSFGYDAMQYKFNVYTDVLSLSHSQFAFQCLRQARI